jgi:hypothetical protein
MQARHEIASDHDLKHEACVVLVRDTEEQEHTRATPTLASRINSKPTTAQPVTDAFVVS